MSYYGEIGDPAPHRLSGWRRRVGQLFRFEVALSGWRREDVGSVLDLGCGTGELSRYLDQLGWEVDYLGVDRRESAIERARGRHDGRFRIDDFTAMELPVEAETLVVMIGGHVDGTAPTDRIARFRRLLTRIRELAGLGASFLTLHRRELRRRPMFRYEEALFGATVSELERLGREAFEAPTVWEGGLQTDLALFGGEGRHDAPDDTEVLVERFLGRRSIQTSTFERAWLWLECGRPSRAREALRGTSEEGDADASEYRLLRRRIAESD